MNAGGVAAGVPACRVWGAPFIGDPVLARKFGRDETFKLDEVLKGGRIIVSFSKERFAAALTVLQSQAGAGGTQDGSGPNAVHVLAKEFKPEIDAIEAFLRSGKTSKKLGELTIDLPHGVAFTGPGGRSGALPHVRSALVLYPTSADATVKVAADAVTVTLPRS